MMWLGVGPTLAALTSGVAASGKYEWFSREWTLRELAAPNDLRAFPAIWRKVGDRCNFQV
jgi:hypothetical protein